MSTAIVGVRPSGRKPLHESPPRPVPVRSCAGRVVAAVRGHRGSRALYATVDARAHMLRFPAAWARDRTVLDQARHAGAQVVVLEDRHAARRWTAPLDAFWRYGFVLDRGHGVQVALPLERWAVEDLAGPAQVDLFDPPTEGG